jgi:hypothetical protein
VENRKKRKEEIESEEKTRFIIEKQQKKLKLSTGCFGVGRE